MRNVRFEVRNDILIINVDLNERVGPSSTGKSDLVATTEGNRRLKGYPNMFFGLHVYVRNLEKKDADTNS
jgi:hypothetical protein